MNQIEKWFGSRGEATKRCTEGNGWLPLSPHFAPSDTSSDSDSSAITLYLKRHIVPSLHYRTQTQSNVQIWRQSNSGTSQSRP